LIVIKTIATVFPASIQAKRGGDFFAPLEARGENPTLFFTSPTIVYLAEYKHITAFTLTI